jgi:hypothetical protein
MGDVLSCLRAHGGKVNDLSHILFLDKKTFLSCEYKIFIAFYAWHNEQAGVAGSSEDPSSSHDNIMQGHSY